MNLFRTLGEVEEQQFLDGRVRLVMADHNQSGSPKSLTNMSFYRTIQLG